MAAVVIVWPTADTTGNRIENTKTHFQRFFMRLARYTLTPMLGGDRLVEIEQFAGSGKLLPSLYTQSTDQTYAAVLWHFSAAAPWVRSSYARRRRMRPAGYRYTRPAK